MEYFDDAWYKCRTGRDDVLCTRMTTLAGLGIFSKKTFLVFSISEKISLDISCQSPAWQTIHMKCQDLFSLANKKNIQIVVCCSCDWRIKGKLSVFVVC